MKFDLQLFATADTQSVHAGHTIFIRVNNQRVGRAQAIDGERSFGTEGIYEIGSIMPQEHINNRYEGSLNIERFFMRNKDLAKIGLAALGEEVLRRGIITFEVVDNYTGEVVRAYYGCTIVTYRETFRVNAIAGENATFTYLSSSNSTVAANTVIS